MKKLLDKDSIVVGVVATLLSEFLCAVVVWLILLVFNLPLHEHLRWFAAAFVPPALLLRHYAHRQEYPTTLKAVIVTLFVTVVAFMWAMLKYKIISF